MTGDNNSGEKPFKSILSIEADCEYCGVYVAKSGYHKAYSGDGGIVDYWDEENNRMGKAVLCNDCLKQLRKPYSKVNVKFPTYKQWARRNRGINNNEQYKCSICNKTGHNKRGCPDKEESESVLEEKWKKARGGE